MSKHNYSQYSNKKKQNEVDATPVAQSEPVIEIGEVITPTPEIELMAETVDTVAIPSVVDGVVVNCARLNVRAEPSLNADVVCVLDAMSEIQVDTDKHTDEWVYVYTATGVEGYCMKKFVNAYL